MVIKKTTQQATWPMPLVMIFCDAIIKEIASGGLANTHLSKEGWKNVVEAFNTSTGKDYDYHQLKNKWDQLKKDYSLWKDLIGNDTRLGWSYTKQTVNANDEWWEKKIQLFPKAKKFRLRGIDPELQDKLCDIFSPIIASGSHAWAPSIGSLPTESVNIIEDGGDYEDEELNINLENITTNPTQDSDISSSKRKNTIGGTQLNAKKGKKGGGKVGGASTMSLSIERLVAAYEARTTAKSDADKAYSIGACMELSF
ncbi:Myb_DNA-bind_3 domain-containing protein [Cephalotus follicularis]|uniref:Myb_DNA-bind_3 domain-containing protein n=1 Tax=Cephalotus follicularis TaxID=3775 RepID=A0A1Q3AM49_CEPFO|nr:Myb_DNA-bind_3 domain-containing protein [Cephalotus follicularis]